MNLTPLMAREQCTHCEAGNAGDDLIEGRCGYRGFIFDFDNTIIDTRGSRLPLLATVAKSLGYHYCRSYENIAWGKPFKRMVSILIPDGDVEEILPIYKSAMRRNAPVILPGVRRLLCYCRRNSISVTVLTSSDPDLVLIDLQSLQLDTYVGQIFGATTEGVSKPNPRFAIPALEWYMDRGVLHDSLLYLGDSVDDLRVARGNGIDFVAILTGASTRQHFHSHGFARCYRSIAEFFSKEITKNEVC